MELGIRIQSLEGFRILGAVFRISKRGIPDSTAKIWCNLDSRSKNFPDSGGVVSGQKQATVYSCSRRTNGKFVIEPLKSTCWKISCWLSEKLFCRLATYIISSPQRLSIRKIQTVGNTSLQFAKSFISFKDLWSLSNKTHFRLLATHSSHLTMILSTYGTGM